MKQKDNKKIIDLSTKTFIQVVLFLFAIVILSIVLTYLIPRGEFGLNPDGSMNYLDYREIEGERGINIFKGIFAPVLVFTSDNGLTLIMLSLFLMVVFASFQVMNDVGGIRVLIGAVADRFRKRKYLLLAALVLVFMCFGAFLGLFEEMLAMLPIITALCVVVGFDSFTGFLVCIISCGFGFATAITNPFTVLLASKIIDVNPMENIWFRFVIFAAMYALMLAFVFIYARKVAKDPEKSLTRSHDEKLRSSGMEEGEETEPDRKKRTKLTYTLFLTVCLAIIIVSSVVEAIRDYTVVILIAYFLIFGLVSGIICTKKAKPVLKSFVKGFIGALPTVAFIALASAIKYIFDEGGIMPTIVHQVNEITAGKNLFVIALLIYGIILVLEFFITSSTAKAILVMGMLTVVNVGLSKQMLVLIYTFADGYTNVLFPTSPVLLISLSMIEMDYFKWIKKSWPLFILNAALILLFLFIGISIGY